MNVAQLAEYLKAGLAGGLKPSFVMPLDSPLLVQAVPQADLVAVTTASVPKPLRNQPTLVLSLAIAAGPRADETGNVGTVYIGGPGVAAATGYPLFPGALLNFGVVDLSQLYIIGANVGDAVRLLFEA